MQTHPDFAVVIALTEGYHEFSEALHTFWAGSRDFVSEPPERDEDY